MDKPAHQQVIEAKVSAMVEALLPNGAGPLTAVRLRTALESVAAVALQQGESYALSSLLTVEDVAQQLGISERRVRTLAADRHARFGVGWQVPGTSAWLFRPHDVEILRPGKPGRRRADES